MDDVDIDIAERIKAETAAIAFEIEKIKEEAARRNDKPRDPWRWIMVFLSILLIGSIVGSTFYVTRYKLYAPLGDYPAQEITLPSDYVVVDTGAGTPEELYIPILHASKSNWPDLPISAIKNSSEETKVHGGYEWRSLLPPGSSYPPDNQAVKPAPGTRKAGTTEFHFSNKAPLSVRDRVADFCAQGISKTKWHLNGYEIPINPQTGEDGVIKIWTTKPFVISYTC